jgi:hypothetical protein
LIQIKLHVDIPTKPPQAAYHVNTIKFLWRYIMLKQLTCFLALHLCVGAVAAQEISYRKNIAALWQAKCVACHGANAPERADFLLDEKGFAAKSLGPRMDTYERFIAFIAWPDTGALMRRLDDGNHPLAGGKPGNMYAYLGSNAEERARNLALVKAWVGDGAWNLNRWEARGAVAAVSKQQMEKIKAAY